MSKHSAESSQWISGRIILNTALIGNVILLSVVALLLWQDYRDISATARRHTDTLVQILAQDIEGDLRALDLALLGIVDEASTGHAPRDSEMDAWLIRVSKHHPMISILGVTNRAGDVIFGPGAASARRINLSDRDYFQRLRDDPGAGLQTTDPVVGKTTDKSVIVLSRRLEDAKGQFSGVVFGSIPVAHFMEKFRRLNLGTRDLVIFRNAKLHIVIRYPEAMVQPSGSLRMAGAFEAALKNNPETGQFDAGRTSLDGVDRMVSYQRNAKFGFYVNVGLARDDVFAAWRQQSALIVAVVLLFALSSTAMAIRLRRSWLDQRQTTTKLQAQESQLVESQRIARLGHFTIDLRRDTWEASPTLEDIYGIDGDFPRDKSGWERLIHPEDIAALTEHVRREVIEQHQVLDVVFRIVRPSGDTRWLHAKGRMERRSDEDTPMIFGSIQDITEQKLSEIQLRFANELLDTASQMAHFGGWSVEIPSMALTWTEGCYHVHGLEPGTPITIEQAMAFYTPDDRPLIAKAVQSGISDGTPWDLELELNKQSGERFWARVFGHAEQKAGKTVRIYGAIVDITEQRNIIADQMESQAKFRSFFDSSLVGMAVTSPKKGWLMVNPALCETLGYSAEALLAKTWAELTHPEDLAADEMQFNRVLAGEIDGYQLEKRFRRSDGTYIEAEISARAVRNTEAEVEFFSASVQDISQRKAAERALQQTREVLEAAGRSAKIGGWSLDVSSMKLTWSEETYRIHELPLGTPVSLAFGLDFYDPVSQPAIAAAAEACIDQATPWDIEAPLRTVTGREVWVRTIGRAERDAAGRVTRLFGAMLDIDHQKHATQALQEGERRIRLLAQHAAAYIYELDLEGRITFVNRVYAGLTEAQVLGTTITDWFPEALRLSISTTLQGVIADQREASLEYEVPDPAGVLRTYEAKLIPVRVDDVLHSVVLTANDITDRIHFEGQLLNSRALLRQFIDHFPGTAFVKDENLRVLMASSGFSAQLGLNPEEMIGRSNEELFPGPFGEKISADDRRILASETTETYEEELGGRYYESTKFVIRQSDRRLIGGITVDVTGRSRSRQRSEALLSLTSLGGTLPEREFLSAGLHQAEAVTGSAIGFLHFVNEDQETIELVTWTDGALKGCQAAYDNHYPISAAGIWADCFRDRAPVTFNDYAGYAAKKGLPPGHARLDRLISVPVIEQGKIRMMIGVGNKAGDYDEFDINSVQLIGNDLWRVVRRERAEQALRDQLDQLTVLNQKLSQAQNQLLQSEKMATIGQLAAGVAHELNNPIGFIQSNLGTLDSYVDDLLTIIDHAANCSQSCSLPNRLDQFKAIVAEKDLAFLRQDVRDLLAESRDGADRVRKIVQNLKDFSHVSEEAWAWADLHNGLESTLRLVWNEVKYKAEVEKQFGEIPEVFCMASQLNQVFMNLLVNAAQAIEAKGKITLRTGVDAGVGVVGEESAAPPSVWIEIEDTGKGIPAENLPRVFDPFFTTKPVGQGTGLGLSLAWSIVQKHHGTFTVESTVGVGTKFRIRLPLNGQQNSAGAPGHE